MHHYLNLNFIGKSNETRLTHAAHAHTTHRIQDGDKKIHININTADIDFVLKFRSPFLIFHNINYL